MNQFVFTLGVYFGSVPLLEGKSVSEVQLRTEELCFPPIIRNRGVFIPTQLVNFATVPHHMRVVAVCVVSLFWNTYLSYVDVEFSQEASSEEKSEEKTIEAAAQLE